MVLWDRKFATVELILNVNTILTILSSQGIVASGNVDLQAETTLSSHVRGDHQVLGHPRESIRVPHCEDVNDSAVKAAVGNLVDKRHQYGKSESRAYNMVNLRKGNEIDREDSPIPPEKSTTVSNFSKDTGSPPYGPSTQTRA